MSEPTEQSFLNDVKNHTLRIIREDGVYRHLRFKQPGTNAMYFDLVTWPGVLCYGGDMGTFVFSRMTDMLKFFRVDKKHAGAPETLGINPSYWAEKLLAVGGGRSATGAAQFCYARFVEVVNEYRVGWMRELKEAYRLNPSSGKIIRRELWDAIEDEVIFGDEDGIRCYDRAYEFSHDVAGRTYRFEDFWDNNFQEWTYQFKWCCYAIAWGVQQYGAAMGGITKDQP